MDKKLVVEGKVEDDGTDVFLHTKPPEVNSKNGYYAQDLLAEFAGKRVRVTVEVLEEEDCPPPTGPDGKRSMPDDREAW